MKILLITLGIIAFIVIIFISTLIGTFNGLVSKREQGRTEQAQIETQLQRRFDLVPNVVAATKGAMGQERVVYDSISKAYGAFARAQSGTPEKIAAGDNLGVALRGFLGVITLQYPELKSLDIVKDLNTVLEGTENRISVSRQRYNESVQVYNRHLQSFPTNILGGMFGFQQMLRFESVTNAEEAPKVDLELGKWKDYL